MAAARPAFPPTVGTSWQCTSISSDGYVSALVLCSVNRLHRNGIVRNSTAEPAAAWFDVTRPSIARSTLTSFLGVRGCSPSRPTLDKLVGWALNTALGVGDAAHIWRNSLSTNSESLNTLPAEHKCSVAPPRRSWTPCGVIFVGAGIGVKTRRRLKSCDYSMPSSLRDGSNPNVVAGL